MDTIDVLGSRPERREVFSRELLAETDDAELQQIVEEAARELAAPIALVTLVLDHIQFFKAHCGLPAELAAARGTSRDVSFCQFVVRDEEPFEVGDAETDERVPRHLVEQYDVRAYLGIPIRTGGVVVGSLCVLDTTARGFTEEQRAKLAQLATLVDRRLGALTEQRRQVRLALAERASGAGVTELRESLAPILAGVEAGLPALAAIRSFLALSAHGLDGGSPSPEALRRSLEAAEDAVEAAEDAFQDIEDAAADCEDCAIALEHLTTPAPSTRLSDVLTAAQDLARGATRGVGGAPLPNLRFDPLIHTARPLAVALVTTALGAVAARLGSAGSAGGIQMQVHDRGATVELALSAEALSDAEIETLASTLGEQIGKDPSVAIHGAGGAVRLAFSMERREPDA